MKLCNKLLNCHSGKPESVCLPNLLPSNIKSIGIDLGVLFAHPWFRRAKRNKDYKSWDVLAKRKHPLNWGMF